MRIMKDHVYVEGSRINECLFCACEPESHEAAGEIGVELMKFENVSCSQCGQNFGPSEHGFSHCSDHARRSPKAAGRTITAEERRADELANEADKRISEGR